MKSPEDPPDQSLEEFLAWFQPEREPLPGPRVACVPITEEALETFSPSCRFRSIELAYQLLKHGPYGLFDAMQWRGDDPSGVFAVHYNGELEHHRGVSDPSSKLPILVGSGLHLVERIQTLCQSLHQVSLPLRDFTCRVLPVAEHADARRRLDHLYEPVWCAIDGVLARQSSPDSRGARSVRSRWDQLFPGRPGAGRVPREDDVLQQLEHAVTRTLARYRRAEGLLSAYATLEEAL